MQNTRSIVASLMAVALSAQADAATLSMRFSGGGREVSLAPGQSATIEILITMGPFDGPKNPSRLTGVDLQFDVGGEVINPGVGPYVMDGSTHTIAERVFIAWPHWNAVATSGISGPFNGSFFLSTGDPVGVTGPTGARQGQSLVVAFSVRMVEPAPSDLKIVFRNLDPIPALYNGPAIWANRFGYPAENGRNQFRFGQGNPGDNGPQSAYHGYETYRPLTIHSVPEPGALIVMLLGTLACLGKPRSEPGSPRPGPAQGTCRR